MSKAVVNTWFNPGDQFAIAYVYLSDVPELLVSTPNIFLISQALESYLKGCLLFKFPSEDPVKYGHNQYRIFKKLKSDKEFFPLIDISQSAYESFNISRKEKMIIAKKDQATVDNYYALLLAFKYGYELRYFGVGLKSVEGNIYGYGTKSLDVLYGEFIAEIRKYAKRNF